jgi:hypothetical protein
MKRRLPSRKALMLEVILAMSLATFLATTVLVSYGKIAQEQRVLVEGVKNVFTTDNLFFTALKEFVEAEAFFQQELLPLLLMKCQT